jgi:hypothetical protein
MNKHYEKFFKIKLPSWVGLLVIGKTLNKKQTYQVITQTDNFQFEDTPYYKTIYNREYHKTQIFSYENYLEQKKYLKDKFNKLDLNFLNNERFISSFIYGEHGWLNWNGQIKTNYYNIGKNPQSKEIYNEWLLIAQAFPFLNLTCQILDDEISVKYAKPILQFEINNGNIDIIKPTKKIISIASNKEIDLLFTMQNEYKNDSQDFIKKKIKALRYTKFITYLKNKNGENL